MTLEQIEDARVAAAFDGPSTEAERLRVRCSGPIGTLNLMINYDYTATEMLPYARELLKLLKRLERAE